MLSLEMHRELLEAVEDSHSRALPGKYPLRSIFKNLYDQQERLLGLPSKKINEYSQEQNSTEIERVYYAKISNLDVLNHAAQQEHQEQWEYRLFDDNKPIGTLRSRMIEMGDRYELTIKSYRKKEVGSIECTLEGNEAMHQTVQAISNRGLRKVRYYFPVKVSDEGRDVELIWEVDVYYTQTGEMDTWVKLDLEIPHERIQAPPIPFATEQVIDASFDRKLSDDDRKLVDGFFDRIRIESS